MKTSIRRLFPPWKWVIVFLFAYGIPLLIDVWGERYGLHGMTVSWRWTTVIFAALAYGAYRAVVFYPGLNRRYGAWLASTPWTSRKPLPNGPAWIGARDFIVVGMLCMFSMGNVMCGPRTTQAFLAPWVPVFFALLSYLAVMSVALGIAKQPLTMIVLLFALPLTVYPFGALWAGIAVLLAVYIVCYVELRRNLAGFPWNTVYWEYDIAKACCDAALKMRVIGWPFRELCVRKLIPQISAGMAVLIGALVTWWVHVGLQLLHERLTYKGLLLIGAYLAGSRLFVYTATHKPPISLLGRLLRLHWIIPGYDRVLVGPLCALAMAYLSPRAMVMAGLAVPMAIELGLFLTIVTMLTCPPSLYDWHMTGSHQITRPREMQQKLGPLSLTRIQ